MQMAIYRDLMTCVCCASHACTPQSTIGTYFVFTPRKPQTWPPSRFGIWYTYLILYLSSLLFSQPINVSLFSCVRAFRLHHWTYPPYKSLLLDWRFSPKTIKELSCQNSKMLQLSAIASETFRRVFSEIVNRKLLFINRFNPSNIQQNIFSFSKINFSARYGLSILFGGFCFVVRIKSRHAKPSDLS